MDAGGRERSRERQRMCNHDQGTEQVAARNHQKCPLAQNGELSDQKSGGLAVANKQGGGTNAVTSGSVTVANGQVTRRKPSRASRQAPQASFRRQAREAQVPIDTSKP